MSAEKKNASAVTGSCLCGGVAFSAQRFDGPVVACHCTQCRKTSGHFVAATRAKRAHIKFSRDETLTWFRDEWGEMHVFPQSSEVATPEGLAGLSAPLVPRELILGRAVLVFWPFMPSIDVWRLDWIH